MLIVLEGVDGAGKSTLAEALGGTYLHHGPPEKDQPVLRQYEEAIQAHRAENALLVVDRLHYGEMVYGPVLRGESKLGWPGFAHVELLLQARGAVTALVDPGLEEVHRRLALRGEDFLPPDRVGEVWREFQTVQRKAFSRKVMVGWGGLEATAQMLLQLAVSEAGQALGLPVGYIGSPRPEVVLVGDVRNNQADWYQTPFPALPGTSGHFLWGHLPDGWHGKVGCFNSAEVDAVQLAQRWVTPFARGQVPRFVALGRLAHERLTQAGVPHGSCPHPQYARRFGYHAGDLYTRALERAAGGQHVGPEEVIAWK